MRMAVVDDATGEVRAVIMASESDTPYPGTSLVIVPESRREINPQWMWSEADGFYPGPVLQAELDAAEDALETEGLDFE